MSLFFTTIICFGAMTYIFFDPDVNAWYENTLNIPNSILDSKILNTRLKTNIDKSVNKLIEDSKEKYNEVTDLENDASLQKYLWKNHPLNNPNYVPPDLEQINLDYIINRAYRPVLRSPARIGFEQMAEAFYKEFNKKLYLVSAYRTTEDQKKLQKKCAHNQCANTEESEHRIWLAIDIHVITNWNTKISMSPNGIYYKRLKNNAHNYWFHNTFSKKSTEIKQEPRHRRYIWSRLATKLHDKNITFGEYYQLQNKEQN